MYSDPIVEEIHRIREAIAAKFNNDLEAIVRDAQRRQYESGATVVRREPRPVDPVMIGSLRKPEIKAG
jgi:hypothetical protein